MGIPITDTLRVMDALDQFIMERIAVCEDMLDDFDEGAFYSHDEFESFTLAEPVRIKRDFCCRNRCDTGGRVHYKFVPKRKEVK